jgi:hypothetical protein
MKIARLVAVALCLLGFAVSPALAQGTIGGVEAGFSMSRESPDIPGITIERGPGLLAGGWVAFQPWVPVGIQLEAIYAQKHMHLTSSSDLKIDYIEIPVLARLKLFKSIYMLEGIAIDFPVSAKVSAATDTDIKSSITSPDLGMIIAGGIPLAPKVSIEFRYEGGFKKLSNVDSAPAEHMRSLSGVLRIKL